MNPELARIVQEILVKVPIGLGLAAVAYFGIITPIRNWARRKAGLTKK